MMMMMMMTMMHIIIISLLLLLLLLVVVLSSLLLLLSTGVPRAALRGALRPGQLALRLGATGVQGANQKYKLNKASSTPDIMNITHHKYYKPEILHIKHINMIDITHQTPQIKVKLIGNCR